MDLKAKVEAALETIRPYLQADGGDVSVEEITKDNIVRVKLLGNCGSCKMSYMTMKAGIEQAIIKDVPQIKAVEAVDMSELS